MLILPIKKKWFDMILSGEKKEEYREIKPYYTKRIHNELKARDSITGKLFSPGDLSDLSNNTLQCIISEDESYFVEVLFRNGYSNNSPSFKAECKVTIGEGNPSWGAIPDEKYFILTPICIKGLS